MKNELKNFKIISDELFKNGGTLNKEKYYEEIKKLHSEFERRFVEFTRLEPIVTFMSYPFGNVDVEEITKNINYMFPLSLEENEVLLLQNDIILKARSSEPKNNFWSLMDEVKYPNLKQVAFHLTSFFGSTYLCESAFSTMKIIKTKYRSRLTDDHLESSTRLAVSNYIPRYSRFVHSMQPKSSTNYNCEN